MKIIDLSMTLSNEGRWAPWWSRSRVRYQDHRFGRRVIRLLFGVPSRLLTTGLGWANENLRLSTHGTTHVDAPYHYAPTCGGAPARTIDELPLEWFFAPGVVVDMTHKSHGDLIGAGDLQAGLEAIGHRLSAGEILLIRTGNDRRIGTREYFTHGPGVSAGATEWMLDQGVRVAGIDSWGWDLPLGLQAEETKEANTPGVFWAAHYVGVRREWCHIERLTNLDKLPPTGFTVAAFPLKVHRGSAGPARVVAILPDANQT